MCVQEREQERVGAGEKQTEMENKKIVRKGRKQQKG